jgi:hypothetical protein
MANLKILRTPTNLVSIPLMQAVYCENCETVSNSRRDRCGVCGSEAILGLFGLIGGPPQNPGPGPAAASQIIPMFTFEKLEAA